MRILVPILYSVIVSFNSLICQDTLLPNKFQLIKAAPDTTFFFKAATNLYGDFYYIPYKNRKMLLAQDKNGQALWSQVNIFLNAKDIISDESHVFILDDDQKEIIILDNKSGKLQHRFGKDLSEKLKDPVSIGLLNNNQLVLLDAGRTKLHFFSKQGILIRSLVLNGIVDPSYMITDGECMYIYDDKIESLIKYDQSGRIYGKVVCDAGKPGDGKGKLYKALVDPLGYLLVFNASKNSVEVYDWGDKPIKFLEIPLGYHIEKINDININPANYLLNMFFNEGAAMVSLQIKVPIPNMEPRYSFTIDSSALKLFYPPLPVKTVTHYSLHLVTETDKDSVIALAPNGPFSIHYPPVKKYSANTYFIKAFNPSQESVPSEKFEDFFGLALYFKNQSMYEEALLAYQNTLHLMNCSVQLKQFIAYEINQIGHALVYKEKRIFKGIDALKNANVVHPNDSFLQGQLKQAYVHVLKQLYTQENYQLLLDEVNKIINDPLFKTPIIQLIDSLAIDMEKNQTVQSLVYNRLFRLKLLDWLPSTLPYWQAAFRVNNLLYHAKLKNNAAEYELQALLSENERNVQKIMTMLQDLSKPYYLEYIDYLNILSLSKKYMELEAQCKKALSSMSNLFNDKQLLAIRLLLAESLIAQKKYDAAIQEYNALVSLQPGDDQYKQGLAAVLFVNNNIPEALSLYKQLLLNDNENPEYLSKIGLSSLALTNFTEASLHLEKALKADPGRKYLYGPLGESYEGNGNFQLAIDQYKIATNYYNQLNATTNTWKNKDNQILEKQYLERLAKLYQQLGQLDQAGEIFIQLTKANPKEAAAWFGLGSIQLNRGLIYEATNSFQVAMNADPGNIEYKLAYQSSIDLRNQASKNTEPLTITNVVIQDLFPSLYTNYSDVNLLPIGEITFTNSSPWPITLSSLSVEIKDLMNQPTAQKTNVVVGFSNHTVKLSALFNTTILDIVQSQNLQLDIIANYTFENKPIVLSKSVPIVIHNRNAINWADKKRIAAFIHAGTGSISTFASACTNLFSDAAKANLPDAMIKAMQVYTALGKLNLKYAHDPDLNYTAVSSNTNLIDLIQYPAETLIKKSGDCDDLVTLYATLLENIGIGTAYIDIPGHIFMAFDLNITPGQLKDMGLDADDVLQAQGKVWIPIETTLIGEATFITAWQSSIKRYRQEINKSNMPDITPIAEARKKYKSSSFLPAVPLPALEKNMDMIQEYNNQIYSLYAKINESTITALKTQQIVDPTNVFLKNKYAVLLAQAGRLIEAKNTLLEALAMAPTNSSILNNLGKLLLQEGNLTEAIIYFEKSYELNTENVHVILNLVKANIKLKNKEMASKWIDLASSLSGKASEYETYRILISQL